MPKKWHRNGCRDETWPEKCPRCEGWGYRPGLAGSKLTCSNCDGKKEVCSKCGKPY